MAQSVLGSLTLGYRPLWNRGRSLAGVQLFVHEDDESTDGAHLLRALGETWAGESPPLLVSPQSRSLLLDLVAHADASTPMIEVPLPWLLDHSLHEGVHQARRRGARLVASGTPQQPVGGDTAGHANSAAGRPWFSRRAVHLAAADAALALSSALKTQRAVAAGQMGGRAESSPVPADAVVSGVASRALADHALDQQGAWAVAGWPAEDVVYRYRGHATPPTRQGIQRILLALEREPSLDRVDHLFGQEPALAYHLLVHLNSAGLGIATGVASLRHGFMMLGFAKVAQWLAQQLPLASDDADLKPVNAAMVLRANLTGHLMDAGAEDELAREIYLCGLFAQLDLLLDEPLRSSLTRIPLPQRLVAAALAQDGPYAPALCIACALETDDPEPVRRLRVEHEMSAEEINRALLRSLAVGLQ
ncbi:MAG: histidine kinase [Variovorax sp.]